MECPGCLEEMELVEGITYRATNSYEEDQTGLWWECPKCGHKEDYEAI